MNSFCNKLVGIFKQKFLTFIVYIYICNNSISAIRALSKAFHKSIYHLSLIRDFTIFKRAKFYSYYTLTVSFLISFHLKTIINSTFCIRIFVLKSYKEFINHQFRDFFLYTTCIHSDSRMCNTMSTDLADLIRCWQTNHN